MVMLMVGEFYFALSGIFLKPLLHGTKYLCLKKSSVASILSCLPPFRASMQSLSLSHFYSLSLFSRSLFLSPFSYHSVSPFLTLPTWSHKRKLFKPVTITRVVRIVKRETFVPRRGQGTRRRPGRDGTGHPREEGRKFFLHYLSSARPPVRQWVRPSSTTRSANELHVCRTKILLCFVVGRR